METNRISDEEISSLEITTRDRYKDNPSTTQRALDKEYVSMLEQLMEAYKIRDGPRRRDNLGWNASDKERVRVYGEILQKLREEQFCIGDMFFKEDLFG